MFSYFFCLVCMMLQNYIQLFNDIPVQNKFGNSFMQDITTESVTYSVLVLLACRRHEPLIALEDSAES